MRKFALFLIIGVLGALCIMQQQHEQDARAAQARLRQAERETSEHNWMKHSLDTTRKVTSQISQQRKEDGVRD